MPGFVGDTLFNQKRMGYEIPEIFFFREYNSIALTTLRNPPKKYRERNSSPIPVPDLKYVSETK